MSTLGYHGQTCNPNGKDTRMTFKETGELLLPREVAVMFRVDPKTVIRWANAGKLRSFRTAGGHRRFRAADVEEFMRQQADGVPG